ncbi:MAG: Hpt domain-containing protein [Proteobacteria bacterium]|nr:Hpt domain-containing protein [Pseudomonadota bacterium]
MPISEAEIVPAEQYPALLSATRRGQAMSLLRSHATLTRANRAIAMRCAELRDAVLDLVDRLRQAALIADWQNVYDATHEIRGLAATAGLPATGRIANGLCTYLDCVARFALSPDPEIVQLHLGAILRSVRTEDDAARHGDTVAQELAALVSRKLGEIKDSASGIPPSSALLKRSA